MSADDEDGNVSVKSDIPGDEVSGGANIYRKINIGYQTSAERQDIEMREKSPVKTREEPEAEFEGDPLETSIEEHLPRVHEMTPRELTTVMRVANITKQL